MNNQINKIFDQIEHELGWNDHNMQRDRPYGGQPHTCTGQRGATEIQGITFRDLRDCYIRAVLLSTGGAMIDGVNLHFAYEEACKGQDAVLSENDLYGFNIDKLDPMAIVQNLCCEVEKIMGIYPNVPELYFSEVKNALKGGAA